VVTGGNANEKWKKDGEFDRDGKDGEIGREIWLSLSHHHLPEPHQRTNHDNPQIIDQCRGVVEGSVNGWGKWKIFCQ